MAGLKSGGLSGGGLTRQHLSTIAWLRWRLLMSAFRKKGVAGEIVARIFLYPIIACFAIGPAIGAGVAGFFLTSRDLLIWLPGPLWLLFMLWQFVGVSTAAAAPSFDLATLTRFPIRFRDYLIVRLAFGLLDPQTMIGGLCLIGMTIGIGIADASLFPWAAFVLFVYGVCNVLFSRMLYSWLDKWLARRKTRELIGAFVLIVSLSFQMINPIMRRLGRGGHRTTVSPSMLQLAHSLLKVGNILPPGLAGSAIALMHHERAIAAAGLALALVGFTAVFLYVLKVRLLAQYHGENLSEAPAAPETRAARRRFRSEVSTTAASRPGLLPAVVAATLRKEIHYLLRSGPVLYSLITPLFMIVVFGSQSFGRMQIAGVGSLSFPYGCAYLQLFLVAFIYNCFGTDGTGVQLYFFAPVRIRDVILGKNLMICGILFAEVTLIYLAISLLAVRPSIGMTALTICWMVLTFLLSMTFGNLRSIYSPKTIAVGGTRSMRLSGLNTLLSFGVLAVPFVLGAGAVVLCRFYGGTERIYSFVISGFGALILASVIGYVSVLNKVDHIAASQRLEMTAELCKT